MRVASMLIMFLVSSANAGVLVEERIDSPLQTTPQSRLITPTGSQNAVSFRSQRPVGVGATVGGAQGLIGIQGEIAVDRNLSVLAAFGGGEGYRTITLQARHSFEGTTIIPYVAGGYSRWYSSTRGPVPQTNPAFLKDAFLSERSKQTGNFGENIVFPSAGLEYVHMRGPYAGTALYAEVTALVDLNRLVVAPTGGLGALYYF